jgi:glycosyltransferase involved in cell wall biosynthesis
MKLPISALVLTFNEEKAIGDCLASIADICDEIFVVDSYSTDKTLQIAGRFTGKIVQHAFSNHAQQRNWAQDTLPIKNEWVVHLDADERLTPELARELEDIFSKPVTSDGFMVSRRTVFRGKWIRFGGHYPVSHLRIFRKQKGRSEERLYDKNYMVDGAVSKIDADIINIINPDLSTWKERHRRWAKLEAEEVLFNRGRKLNMGLGDSPIGKRNWLRYHVYYRLPLFLRALVYFFYRYVLMLGFLDGLRGSAFHFWHGLWYRMLVDYRIAQLSMKGKNVHPRD